MPQPLSRNQKQWTVLAIALALLCSLPQIRGQTAGSTQAAERRPASVVVREPVPVIASKRFHFRAADATLAIPCESTASMTDTTPGIRHLIVMVHGLFRTNHYHDNMVEALKLAGSPKEVAVISPQFLAGVDIAEHKLGDYFPYWSVNGWLIGHLSRNDPELPRTTRVSSFEVLDSLLRWSLQAFPDLESVAVCGFSAGGQVMSRYAAGNQVHPFLAERGIDVAYVISAPSTYLYLCANRPLANDPFSFGPVAAEARADCPGFNLYPHGLEQPNEYMKRAGDAGQIIEQLKQRRLVLLVGEKDDASASYGLSDGCRSNLLGAHRLERAMAYYEYLKFLHGPEAHERNRLLVVPGAAHNSREVFASAQGVEAILGNFRR